MSKRVKLWCVTTEWAEGQKEGGSSWGVIIPYTISENGASVRGWTAEVYQERVRGVDHPDEVGGEPRYKTSPRDRAVLRACANGE